MLEFDGIVSCPDTLQVTRKESVLHRCILLYNRTVEHSKRCFPLISEAVKRVWKVVLHLSPINESPSLFRTGQIEETKVSLQELGLSSDVELK